VILPGLGGFVANYKPAEFDSVRNTASPPSKHILFNNNLVHNDGLLYAHVSEATRYGYKDIQNMALSFMEGIGRNTRKGMKYVIDGLGYFYLDGEGQIQFTEEAENNYLLESYGLPLLQYREFEKLPKPESYRTLTTEVDPVARQKRIRQWVYGTAAAFLVSAMIFIPLQTNYFNKAGIDLPTADSFHKEQTSLKESYPESGSLSPINQANLTPSVTLTVASKTYLPDPEYHIVVGSFKDFGNARQLRNQLVEDGYTARILSSEKGFYRVSAGTYSQQSEAEGKMVSVRSGYENAWILSN
jgi:hypothetical protein